MNPLKTLKQFSSFKNSIVTEKSVQQKTIVFEELEATNQFDELFWEEGKSGHHNPMDPPAVLIMKRKSIRQFPNGQRVALYYVDKIHKYVTVPYVGMQWSVTSMPEEVQASEPVNVIVELEKIKKSHQDGTIIHEDGSTSIVGTQTAQAMLSLHKSLNEDNKKKFVNLVARSDYHLEKASEFSRTHLK